MNSNGYMDLMNEEINEWMSEVKQYLMALICISHSCLEYDRGVYKACLRIG